MKAIQMNTSNTHNWKKNIKVTVTSSELEKVKQLTQLMPHEARTAFKNTYGRIMDLLFISVEASVLSALSQFWNPSLSCFELPDLDTTPTIEEYMVMIRLPIREKIGVYLHQGQYVSAGKVAQLIGAEANQMELEVKGSVQGVKRSFLEAHMQVLAQQRKWDVFNRTLALTIYGLILFPFTPNIVDQAAMDVFFKFETRGMNPVPAILADTFLSLGVCIQKRGGRLRCCLSMLYIWFMTHVYADHRMGRFPDPLGDFHRIQTSHQEAQVWKNEFSTIQSNTFKWVCPWYHGENVIYSCGDFPNVPLVGTRGCVSYTPALVLRQLHWTQTKPQEEQLKGFSFLYHQGQDTTKQEDKIKRAWQDVKILGKRELGEHRMASSHEYREWRKVRVGQSGIPSDVPEKHASIQTQETSRMASQVELMKAQMRFLEEKKEEADLEIVILQSQCEKMAKEIEALKEECVDTAEAAKSRRDTEKISATHLARIQKLERKLLVFAKEKSKLEKEVIKKSRTMGRVEEEVNKRDKNIWSLKMEVNREKEAKRQLEEEISREKNARKKLEQQMEHLSSILAETKHDNAQGWASAKQYHKLFVDATEFGRSWRDEALEWKEKYGRLTDELSHYIPNFVYRFEKANEEIDKMPPFRLPREVTEFMDSCEVITKSLKRKKMKYLM